VPDLVDEELDAMSWFYVDDEFYDHLKLAELPAELELACVGLWTKAGSWSRRHLTGGQIPRGQVRRLGGTDELAAALVAVGLWESTSAGYAFHDWGEWQETPAEVEAKRARWKRQKAAQRQAQAEQRAARAIGAMSAADTSEDTAPDSSEDSGPDDGGTSPPTEPVHGGHQGGQVNGQHGGQKGGRSALSAGCPPAVRPPVPGIPNSQFPSPNSQIPDPGESARGRAREPLPVLEGELDEGEPEPEVSTAELVETAYKARYAMATGNPPGSSEKKRADYRAIASWVDEKNGDAKRIITTLMSGFFRDKWAQKKSFPLGALANEPGKYFNAAKNGRGYLHTSESFGPASSLDEIGPPAPGEAE
jgi:hypothetical protein